MESFILPLIKSTVALFLITDSLGNLPFFIELTQGYSESDRKKVFHISLISGFSLLFVFLIGGMFILDLFNLSINDLKIAGGILLLLIAIQVLIQGKVEIKHKEDIGVVPLGCPLIAGPGAITTSMVLLAMYGHIVVITSLLICFFLIWLILNFASYIYGFLGKNGSLVLTQLINILIATIAVQFIRDGIINLIR